MAQHGQDATPGLMELTARSPGPLEWSTEVVSHSTARATLLDFVQLLCCILVAASMLVSDIFLPPFVTESFGRGYLNLVSSVTAITVYDFFAGVFRFLLHAAGFIRRSPWRAGLLITFLANHFIDSIHHFYGLTSSRMFIFLVSVAPLSQLGQQHLPHGTTCGDLYACGARINGCAHACHQWLKTPAALWLRALLFLYVASWYLFSNSSYTGAPASASTVQASADASSCASFTGFPIACAELERARAFNRDVMPRMKKAGYSSVRKAMNAAGLYGHTWHVGHACPDPSKKSNTNHEDLGWNLFAQHPADNNALGHCLVTCAEAAHVGALHVRCAESKRVCIESCEYSEPDVDENGWWRWWLPYRRDGGVLVSVG